MKNVSAMKEKHKRRDELYLVDLPPTRRDTVKDWLKTQRK